MAADRAAVGDPPAVLNPLAWRPDLDADLATIEASLARAAVAADDSLTEIAGHLIAAGGKRLRPSMLVAAGLVGRTTTEAIPERLVTAAVAVELVHLGSLYHDDVIDGAATRRGVETVNRRWGNLKAILAGDFLLARASELAASLSTTIAELLAETIGWLCEGQIRELSTLDDRGRSETQYLEAIDGKTASLFATACTIGALAVDTDDAVTAALTAYGRAYGTAYQIRDDVADITGSSAHLGKPVATDIASGVFTLPVIRALADDHTGRLAELLRRRGDTGAAAEANRVVRDSDAIASSLATAAQYAGRALDAIEPLGDDPAAGGLRVAAKSLAG